MNLLITGAWSCSTAQLEELCMMGHKVFFMPQERDELPCEYDEVDGVICNGLFLYHDIGKFSNLKYIQLTSAGFDRVPIDYVVAHNIKIYNARGVYSKPMAEYAIGGVLQLYKQTKFFLENQINHKWEKNRELLELSDKTVLIVGCGSVGTECAKRFKAFDCYVNGIDIQPYDNDAFETMNHLSCLDRELSRADIVVLTLPLTCETKYLFNAYRFEQMKKNAILVNISRGAVVDENALIDALQNKLYGAVLDVFEEEPLDEKGALWDIENVIITPHNSFVGDGNTDRLSKLIFDNLRS